MCAVAAAPHPTAAKVTELPHKAIFEVLIADRSSPSYFAHPIDSSSTPWPQHKISPMALTA